MLIPVENRYHLQNAFGEVLRELRIKRGISQENLAFESDLDRSYISLLERGLRQPTLTTVFLLANTLECRGSELVRRAEEKM